MLTFEAMKGDTFSTSILDSPDTDDDCIHGDLEIERSLYYLGRALYRFSFLQKQKGNDGS